MKNPFRFGFCVAALLAVTPGRLAAQQPRQLYRATLVQAAPGRLLEVIELIKQRSAVERNAGEPDTWILRHSQGDHWDLLVLTAIGGYAEYFGADRDSKRQKAYTEAGFEPARLRAAIAWQEDVFVWGPPALELSQAFVTGGLFHAEMFHALPGSQAGLRRQREMENVYLEQLARPKNFIFTRDMGAAWDLFTLGVYRDLKHYAETVDIPQDKQEAAARTAGFQSVAQIGPYLRTFIRSHHDTLGSRVE